jgi:hypothetical protein
MHSAHAAVGNVIAGGGAALALSLSQVSVLVSIAAALVSILAGGLAAAWYIVDMRRRRH